MAVLCTPRAFISVECGSILFACCLLCRPTLQSLVTTSDAAWSKQNSSNLSSMSTWLATYSVWYCAVAMVAAGWRSLFDSCQGAEIFRLAIAFNRSLQSVQRPEGSSISNVTLGWGGLRLLWRRVVGWSVRNIVTSQKSQVLSTILCRLTKLILQLGNSLAFDESTEGGLFPVGLNCAHCFVWCFVLVKQ